MTRALNVVSGLGTLCVMVMLGRVSAAGPAFVDITWMSISNMFYEIGPVRIVTDGYISRLPQSAFSGGGGGLAQTSRPFTSDVAAVTRVVDALGKPSRISLLLTGHSHWDHSFDTGTWSKLTGARVIGSQTTCLQVRAQGLPPIAADLSTVAKRFRSQKA